MLLSNDGEQRGSFSPFLNACLDRKKKATSKPMVTT